MHDLSQMHAGVTEHNSMTTVDIFKTSHHHNHNQYGILKDVSAISYSANKDLAKARSDFAASAHLLKRLSPQSRGLAYAVILRKKDYDRWLLKEHRDALQRRVEEEDVIELLNRKRIE